MKSILSILLGSGFSVPAGLRTVTQLNERLKSINESEIHIHSSEVAFFISQPNPNSWSRADERVFLQEFLEFYNSKVIGKANEFNYESFFDFTSSYPRDEENKHLIEGFYEEFNKRHKVDEIVNRDCLNRIADFNRTFSQLLASLLYKADFVEDVSTTGYPGYGQFLGFLSEVVKSFEIKVHTLNHDMLFDWLGRSVLFEHYSDGFRLAGSPFYGELNYRFDESDSIRINKSYKVKLETFADDYQKSLCLYKLHGGINQRILFTQRQNSPVVRIKTNYRVEGYYMEVWDEKIKEYRFERLFDRVEPDYLTGTTTKMLSYSHDPHYATLFNHFEANLKSSELLLIIGYGFKDPGINSYLEEFFLASKKRIVIIDPGELEWHGMKQSHVTHIKESIADVSKERLISLLPKS